MEAATNMFLMSKGMIQELRGGRIYSVWRDVLEGVAGCGRECLEGRTEGRTEAPIREGQLGRLLMKTLGCWHFHYSLFSRIDTYVYSS